MRERRLGEEFEARLLERRERRVAEPSAAGHGLAWPTLRIRSFAQGVALGVRFTFVCFYRVCHLESTVDRSDCVLRETHRISCCEISSMLYLIITLFWCEKHSKESFLRINTNTKQLATRHGQVQQSIT